MNISRSLRAPSFHGDAMFKKKETDNKKDNFMLYVPFHKHKEWTEKKGRVTLIFHHDHPVQKIAFWLIKKPRVSTLELDELGSAVWKAIDGKRNVYEIGQLIKVKFGESCEPLYDRLIQFLRYLLRRGWINFENKQ